jgi:redox-sensing transcriptional repressor
VTRKISESTVRRLSFYLRFLEEFERAGLKTVSSEELGRRGGTTSAQVRKDLSLFGSFGKRGLGYNVLELSETLRGILGLEQTWPVALVGAGRIGSALFAYGDFRGRGFRIVEVFDSDPKKVGTAWGDVTVRDTAELEARLETTGVEIVILAVPADAVQALVDRVVDAGVKAILNFAPTQLKVPADVAVQDVDMSMELEALSFALSGGAARVVSE